MPAGDISVVHRTHCTRRALRHVPGLCLYLAACPGISSRARCARGSLRSLHDRGRCSVVLSRHSIRRRLGCLCFSSGLDVSPDSLLDRNATKGRSLIRNRRNCHVACRRMGSVCALVRLGQDRVLLSHHRGEGRSHRSDHLRAGRASSRTLAFLLHHDHGLSRATVATFPNGPCISDRVWADCLRPRNPVFHLAANGSLNRNGHAGSVRFPGLGTDTWFAVTPKMPGAPPGFRFPLTAFVITWVIGASALLVAGDGAAKADELLDFDRDRDTS